MRYNQFLSLSAKISRYGPSGRRLRMPAWGKTPLAPAPTSSVVELPGVELGAELDAGVERSLHHGVDRGLLEGEQVKRAAASG